MITHLLKRIVIGLCFAVPLGLLGVVVAEARSPLQDAPREPLPTDCNSCHESVVTHWEESAHGQAVADPVFQRAWQEQGSPSDCLRCHTTGYDAETGTWETEGIDCQVCHSMEPGTTSHPEQIMPTDSSSRACGTCHIDTHAEWQTSAHGEGELTCVRCHNPHTTNIRAGNVQDLCKTCHTEEGHFYTYTGHAQEGLLCTDCHLRVSDSQMGEGHGQRLHTFAVDLDTCNRCHDHEMHSPMTNGEEVRTGAATLVCAQDELAAAAEQAPAANEVAVQEEPAPANPMAFALLPALFGLAFGVILSPWIEGWYRRVTQK